MDIFRERLQYKPFEYGNITTPLVDSMWASHWTHHEFNFKSDVQDFLVNVSEEEREVIKRSALLISQIEVAVKSYWGRLGELLPKPEIADMGAVFSEVEVKHSMAYSRILEVLSLNNEFEKLFSIDVVNNRVKYLNKYKDKRYGDNKKNILYSLILYTIFTEAVTLFSQFYILLGFSRFRGIFKDISNVVQYTSKEEEIHARGGIELINVIISENPDLFDSEFKKRIYEETKEACEAEDKLIDWVLQGYENEFVSEHILKKYIRYRFNEYLSRIGINKPYKINQEDIDKFIWMEEEILAPSLTDFFNKRPIDYAKANKSFDPEDIF